MSGGYATFEGKGFSIESNTRSAEQLATDLGETPKAPEASPAPAAAPVEASDDAEGQDHAEAAPAGNGAAEKALGKPRHDMKARMLEATRKESEAKKRVDEIERRAEQLEAELRRIKAGQVEPKPAEAPKEAKPADGRPKLENFESIEDHAEAVANWVADGREKSAKEARQAAETERATEERFSTFSQRMASHIETDPDFWSRQNKAVVELRPFSVLTQEERSTAGPLNALADHFLVSDKAPALIEYFSGKPDELQRLSMLRPGDFWRELGRIEERLSAAPTATAPQPISKAAPPARPVTGGPPSSDNGPSEKDSDDDYIRKATAARLRKLKASA